MARSIIHACILVSVIYMTAGQSTSADPRCVYTFNVPTSDCGQTPGPSVDDQIWKSSVIALQAQVKQLASDNKQLANDVRALREQNDKQDSELRNLKKERPNSDPGRTHTEHTRNNFNLSQLCKIINKRTFHITLHILILLY